MMVMMVMVMTMMVMMTNMMIYGGLRFEITGVPPEVWAHIKGSHFWGSLGEPACTLVSKKIPHHTRTADTSLLMNCIIPHATGVVRGGPSILHTITIAPGEGGLCKHTSLDLYDVGKGGGREENAKWEKKINCNPPHPLPEEECGVSGFQNCILR